MSSSDPTERPLSSGGAQFPTTHWSVVLSAGRDTSVVAANALESLCRAYWYPLYVFVRRKGYEAHEAQDLTQSFFARLLEKDYLSAVDRSKGKFRSFLLAAMSHFLANTWRDAHAQKRGGRAQFISIDDDLGENQYIQLASSDLSPEELFEQQWAVTLLEKVMVRLREEFVANGKLRLFEHLKIFLTGERNSVSYAELAAQLETSEGALKMAVSRMRHRYVELLRAEIAITVGSPAEVEEELRALVTALSSRAP
jgi:RNA polymerase sigma-70 factor (ECF subfamily)